MMGYLAMALISATAHIRFWPKRTNSMNRSRRPLMTLSRYFQQIPQAGKNDPRLTPGLSSNVEASKSIRRPPALSSGLLDRLVGITRQIDIHLTELRQLGNVGVISLLGVLRLDLEHLRRMTLRQSAARRHGCRPRMPFWSKSVTCGGNGLETLVHLTERPDRRIEAVLAHPLNLFVKLLNVGHFTTSISRSRLARDVACEHHMRMLLCTAQYPNAFNCTAQMVPTFDRLWH